MAGPLTHQAPPTTLWGRLRYLGPGLIITGSIVGSGELVATTKLGAEAGFVLLWLIILGCLVKVFVQVELGRYTIASSETTLRTLDRLPGPRVVVSWGLWIWLAMYVAVVLQASGILGLVAEVFINAAEVSALGFLGTTKILWTGLVVLSAIVLLAWGRYRLVERLSLVLVSAFTCLTVVAVVLLQWTESSKIAWSDLAEGMSFRFSQTDGSPLPVLTAFAAFGITGVGASELIYYPYWCLEKGYSRLTGPQTENPAWAERARGWLRVMTVDAWVSFVVYTLATAAFYLLGAAVLHPQQIPVNNVQPIENLSAMYRESFGDWGLSCFLLGAFVVLYSTFFVATASNARLFVDSLSVFRIVRYRDEKQSRAVLRATCVLLPLVSAGAVLALGSEVSLVLLGGVAQGFMLPILALTALYVRYRHLDPRLAPGFLWTACLWIAFLAMAAIGLVQVLDAARLLEQLKG